MSETISTSDRSANQNSQLFEPLTAGELTLNNRLTMAALTRQRAGEDGTPTDLHRDYYSQRASAGMVVTEGVFPAYSCRAFPGQAGIANDEHAAAWEPVVKKVHEAGGTFVMQIMHGGRTSHPDLLRGAEPEAPSALATGWPARGFGGKIEAPVPREMTLDDVARVKREFLDAARRAMAAGFDGVELHGANGYLLHQFLSPVSNVRTDEYGGSPDGRARIVVELLRELAEEIGAGRVGLRISPQHNIQGALEEDDADVLATYGAVMDAARELGIAYVSMLYADVDGLGAGGDVGAGDGRGLVAQLRERFGGVFILNSGFAEVTQLDDALHIVEDDLADAVAVGRMFIANPDLVRRWRDGLELNEPDTSTFYVGGAHGYTDYPFVD
ncbi:alkene reductase [Corynebacterium sp. H78]|uniref:alkene reductase n=1 Tax=Corynebacterium sp. H78 TaxID=3133417 RepID=UPI0030B4B322